MWYYKFFFFFFKQKTAYEMVQKRGGGDPMSSMIGNAAIDLFTKPMAQIAKAWSVRKVNEGDREVQMPNAAVAGAGILLHRSGGTGYTKFKDNKGQGLEGHTSRRGDCHRRVVVSE